MIIRDAPVSALDVSVDSGRTEIYGRAAHPYSQALMSAVPIPDPDIEAGRERVILEGDLPSTTDVPSGCRIRTRCPIAIEACAALLPPPRALVQGHRAACIRIRPTPTKREKPC